MTTYAYSRSGSIIATEASGRVQSFAADSAEAVALLASGVVPAAYVAPVPQVVSAFQAQAALLDAGLLPAVEALMTDNATPAKARLAWRKAIEFRRDSPTVAAMAAQLGLTARQMDDLFVAAERINA